MKITEVVIHRLKMPLQMRFETSFGVQTDRNLIVTELHTDDGLVGWGESVAGNRPVYNEETTDTVEAILKAELIPLVLGQDWDNPAEFTTAARYIHGNHMAKFAIEGPLWDLWAKAKGVPLATAIGGRKTAVDVGVSIGIKPMPELLAEIEDYTRQGYKRIKIKVKPGWDVEPVKAIREVYPDLPLMVDANAAYDQNDLDHLRQLDPYGLMMIEQPLRDGLWDACASLQASMNTPICLDESVHTLEDAHRAIEMRACRIINVKLGRIGGIQPALELSETAKAAGIELWCGGMLETGVGRAFNIAIATLDTFTMPGDTAASRRYWNPDIITPEVTVDNGQVHVPTEAGIGYGVDAGKLQRYQDYQLHFRR